MDYGVSNRSGRPALPKIADIFEWAAANGIGYLDTAAGYGDAEAIIGQMLKPQHAFKIVTKLLPLREPSWTRKNSQAVFEGLRRSLDRLRVNRIHGLLLHSPDDLDKPGAEYLIQALQAARSQGLVASVGVSVYNAGQIEIAAQRMPLEIVQVPLNVLDRRLVDSGILSRLKAAGTEIHARSVFLQGLLLLNEEQTPAYFAPMMEALRALRAIWRESGYSPLAGCLSYALANPDVDAVIVGVNSRSELAEIISAAFSFDGNPACSDRLPKFDERLLNPALWPKFDR